jgi:glutamate--cysteine ligase
VEPNDERRRALRDALHARCFAPTLDGRCRIGAEVELLTIVEGSTLPPPLFDAPRALVPALRRLAPRLGWTERTGYDGMPRFDIDARAVVSFEPGGQIEVSSAPCTSVRALVRLLDDVVPPLRGALADEGITLRAVGIDPVNDAHAIPLQLPVDRYERMTRHFDRIGPFGIRMMRQTAAIQVSLDRGAHPSGRWRLLNDLAPYLIAIFANSPTYHGRDTGHQSVRAHCWRELDRSRTGVAMPSDDPAGDYTEFALHASDLLHGESGASFAASIDSDIPLAEVETRWAAHLTTLFPEVRPRGHFEVRSCDALEPGWYAAPLVFLAALTYDERGRTEAARLVRSRRDTERDTTERDTTERDADALLRRAGERGLRDEAIAATARDLFQRALRSAVHLGEAYIGGEALERAHAFYERYTARARSPADDRRASDAAPRPVIVSVAAPS